MRHSPRRFASTRPTIRWRRSRCSPAARCCARSCARVAALLGGHITVRVVTPAELALRLGEPALIAAGRTPIAPLADRALAQELARQAESYFEPVRETPGFANA